MEGATIQVLLVEDNPFDADLIKRSLARHPNFCDVSHVALLEDAIEAAKELKSDIMLLDLFLPDSAGLETIRKAREEVPDLPIVVLTGLDDDRTALTAVREGAQDYCVKGEIDPRPLMRTMQLAIERKYFENLLIEVERSQRTAGLARLAAGVAQEIDDPTSALLKTIEHVSERADLLATTLQDLRLGTPAGARSRAKRRAPAAPESGAPSLGEVVGQMRSMLDDSLGGLQRIRRIAAELCGFARLDSERAEWLNLRDLVDEVCGRLLEEGPTAGPLVLDLDNVPPIAGLPEKLRRAVLAVVRNALDAVARTEPTKAARVRVQTRYENRRILIEVDDTGCGMPSDVRTRALEPFFTTDPLGLGLGLTLCSETLRRHGGDIRLESRPGEGTRVLMSLPTDTCLLPIGPAEDGAREKLRSGSVPCRVLLVGDDPIQRTALSRGLEARHDVRPVASPEEALEVVGRDPDFDVILSDLRLSPGDSIALYDGLESVAPRLCGRLVFLVAEDTPAQDRAFIASCDAARLAQPTGVEDLLLTIEIVSKGTH